MVAYFVVSSVIYKCIFFKDSFYCDASFYYSMLESQKSIKYKYFQVVNCFNNSHSNFSSLHQR